MKLFSRNLRHNIRAAAEQTALHIAAVTLGVGASLLSVLAVADYEGYISQSQVWNMAPALLGTYAALAAVGGIGLAYAERSA